MSRFDDLFARRLGLLDIRSMRRVLRPVQPLDHGRVVRDGHTLVNFSGNDYLGLSQRAELRERAADWALRWGAGSGASRLVSGTLDLHKAVEAKLAGFKGTEAALIFNSGWQANASILAALTQRDVLGDDALVFCDRLNHASLHHGCQAAGLRQIRFRHNDLGHLESLLNQHAGRVGRRFIVTESVFSMDGDQADIAGLAALAERFDAFLYVDEAHATGVLGPQGGGLSATVPRGAVDLVMGTFSKAFGSFGGYVAGSKMLCDHLVNHVSGFIYTTALPPAVLGAIDAALDLVPAMDAERAHLQILAGQLRGALDDLRIPYAGSTTQIVPAVLGSAEAVLQASAELAEAGFLGGAIRPPTVPTGTARLRFSLSAAHGAEDVVSLCRTLTGLSLALAGPDNTMADFD
ncbi:MAG TPA: 8-amino-7-oxononanoate synthase [Stellaceae bacterium]|nr:8-amino-7-oxononanoate synthase [Stellaceae bacterium]